MNQANTQATNAVTNLHAIVVRYNPISNTPVVFLADHAPENNQVELVLNDNEHRLVDIQYYKHCLPLPKEQLDEVVSQYAEMSGTPRDALRIRERMPMKERKLAKPRKKKTRHTNDAHMVGSGTPQRRATDKQTVEKTTPKEEYTQESSQDYRSANELASAAQALHDAETNKNTDDALKPLEELAKDYPQEAGKATSEGITVPAGATVTPISKGKRAYNKRSPEEKAASAKRSAKSRAALERYHRDLVASQEKNNLVVEQSASNVSEDKRKEAVLQLAAEIAAVLLKHPDVL